MEFPPGIEELSSQTGESTKRKLALAPINIELLVDARTSEE